ncbi:MAG: cytochrome P450 [Betaproteobacteria bacterium HGW-Betaproteobacteria-22]|nr:MAG: cytochrome P450 [Betaproteobacteria bacterium HGW-Betaproteobacteria-22]
MSFFKNIWQQIMGVNPFNGDVLPSRVHLFERGRPCLPFPHLLNYKTPLLIFDAFYANAKSQDLFERDNRYLYVMGMPPVLLTRDPAVIKSILLATGDKPGQFDRDTSPMAGIARVTGVNSLLYANGKLWRKQKQMSARPFGRGTLFQPEEFHEFEKTFRATIEKRLTVLRDAQNMSKEKVSRIEIEQEIQPIMLEMLVNNFFGGSVEYTELRERYVPALLALIDYMITDTVAPNLSAIHRLMTGKNAALQEWRTALEDLTDIALAGRDKKSGHWKNFTGMVEDEEALRSNVRVFLAGALEATTSFAAWALSHLAQQPELQEEVFGEIKDMNVYDPESLAEAKLLNQCMDETLRLTPSLYFFPRKATADTWLKLDDTKKLMIPKGTTIRLDIWNANRNEFFWGKDVSGYPADSFAPARWDVLANEGISRKNLMHFGFGYGARVCPGQFLGMLEVGLVVGAFIKVFRFRAANKATVARAGVTTKPGDNTLLDIELR